MARSRLYCLLFSWHWHLVCVSPIFASNCLKLNFKLFFLTDVSNYCEERKIKLSVNVYIKIARNLGSNFWNFGSNFLDFWQFFSNLLAFQWATFQHFTSTIGIALLGSPPCRMIWIKGKINSSGLGLIQTPLHSCAEPNSFKFDSGATWEWRLIQTAYFLPHLIRQILQKSSKQFLPRRRVRNSVQTCGLIWFSYR